MNFATQGSCETSYACLCPLLTGYTIYYWGSVGLATAATYVSHACPCLVVQFYFSVLLFYLGQLGFAMNLVLLFHYWGLLWDLRLYPKAVLPLPVYCMLTVYLSLSLGRLGGSLLR